MGLLQKCGASKAILQAAWRPPRWDTAEPGLAGRGSEIQEGVSGSVRGICRGKVCLCGRGFAVLFRVLGTPPSHS